MQSYIISKKVVVSDFKKVDKREKNVGQHDFNSNFEDEISAPKMKKLKNKIRENAGVTRLKVNVSVGKVDDEKFDKKKSRNVCKYVFRDIVFTDEKEVEFNLGAIYQDILSHEHHYDSDHFEPPISEDVFIVLKNEIANVRRDMSLFQEKNKIISEFVLADIKIKDKDWFRILIHTGRSWNDEYIRGYKLLANAPWDSVDNIIIPVNVSELFHWILVVFRIRHSDCGMFVCAFAEYVSHGMFDIFSRFFGAINHQLKYDALLWDYARRKQNDGAINESEAPENVISKYGGFKRSRKQFESSRIQYYQL
ncbi:hypothetical protein FXO38_07382 [Capsicum annuum]|nr:hypothetical protein FXO38_07382 [Capsicum annuum]